MCILMAIYIVLHRLFLQIPPTREIIYIQETINLIQFQMLLLILILKTLNSFLKPDHETLPKS